MIRSYSVTPSLYIGEIPLGGGIRCATTEDALGVIYSGETAVLPHTYWATATDVLRALGLSDRALAERIQFAQVSHF